MNLPHSFYLGLFCWIAGTAIAVRMFWIFPVWAKRLSSLEKSLLALIAVALFVAATYKPVANAYTNRNSGTETKPKPQSSPEPTPAPASVPNINPSIEGFLQLDHLGIWQYRGRIVVDTTYANPGGTPVDNVLISAQAFPVDLKQTPTPDTALENGFQKALTEYVEKSDIVGSEVGAGKAIYTSSVLPNLENEALDGLRDGSWRIYILSMSRWEKNHTLNGGGTALGYLKYLSQWSLVHIRPSIIAKFALGL